MNDSAVFAPASSGIKRNCLLCVGLGFLQFDLNSFGSSFGELVGLGFRQLGRQLKTG